MYIGQKTISLAAKYLQMSEIEGIQLGNALFGKLRILWKVLVVMEGQAFKEVYCAFVCELGK